MRMFEILYQPTLSLLSMARRGQWHLNEHKMLETPTCLLYMRRGSVPHLTSDMLEKCQWLQQNYQLVLEDLLEEPGYQTMKLYGKGMHSFIGMGNAKNVLIGTLRDPRKYMKENQITDKSIFINIYKGRMELSIEQYMKALNTFQLDVITPPFDTTSSTVSQKRSKKAVDRSLQFLDTCISLKNSHTKILGIIGGGFATDERKRSAMETSQRVVDGFLIEGLGLGESIKERETIVKTVIDHLPKDRIRMVHGVGSPEEVLRLVDMGIDVFDSAYAVTMTEMGYALLISKNISDKINLWDTAYQKNEQPLSDTCDCFACRSKYSRAYIHHLLNAHEMLASVLLMSHNLHEYISFFDRIRISLEKGTFQKDFV